MTRVGVGILTFVAAGPLSRPALAQRLTPTFPRAVASWSFTPGASVPAAPFAYRDRECRMSPGLTVGVNGLAGAAAGWLAYELTWGILVSAEGARPDATVRRIRTTLIVAGAGMGVARGVYVVHACRAR